MKSLYPPLDAYAAHRMSVGEGREVYVEECGNPRGNPVIFLHGGPGSGCAPDHRRYFDPSCYRVILLDQRGSGRSTPSGDVQHNTTWTLIQDLETIRSRLGIARWLLFGGSWGATLALVYAQTHPGAASGMVLRGTFLARPVDLHWFFGGEGVARVLPEQWDAFCRPIPAAERGDPVRAYHRRVHGEDIALALNWARGWSTWTDGVVTWNLTPTPPAREVEEDSERRLAKVRIETHYALNRYFLAEHPILERIDALPGVPVSIVHGQRDLTCALEASWTLHRAVRGSRLLVVPDAGHIASEPAMIDALVGETDRLRSQPG